MTRSAQHDQIVTDIGRAYDIASETPDASAIPWGELFKLIMQILAMILPLIITPPPTPPTV
jgi:hypothetical protein